MIYLITGVPGSGKTLYAVSTLVQTLVKQKPVKNGKVIDRRLVVDGIPDLIIPHEKLSPLVEDANGVLTAEGDSLLDWPKWCQPGDVIVIDEVQRYWRPRGMGTKPPPMIKALETHRHMGVDFVIITQNPMLIDQNVRRLVGRHQNVRRLLGMKRAIIYDWDGCSTTLSPKSSTGTTFFNYPASAYALYKSSELHTKPKQKIPLWLGVPVLALAGALFVGPKAFATLTGAMSGKGVTANASTSAPAAPVPVAAISAPVVVPVAAPASVPSAPESPVAGLSFGTTSSGVAGCIVANHRCGCFDAKGATVEVGPGVCESATGQGAGAPSDLASISESPRPASMSPEQLESYRFAFLKSSPNKLPSSRFY